jgi:hypothetical protein
MEQHYNKIDWCACVAYKSSKENGNQFNNLNTTDYPQTYEKLTIACGSTDICVGQVSSQSDQAGRVSTEKIPLFCIQMMQRADCI